jgi:hypothetical protein
MASLRGFESLGSPGYLNLKSDDTTLAEPLHHGWTWHYWPFSNDCSRRPSRIQGLIRSIQLHGDLTMPNVYIDQSQVVFEQIATQDTDGSDVDTLAFIVPVIIPIDQVPGWEAAYDPDSGSSPLAADSRVIARAVLDGMKAAAEGE